jgi:hypothetical protein
MPRKPKKYHYVYKTTNAITGKFYIGMHSTDNLNDGYLGSGKRLKYSLSKYGKENHRIEILKFVADRKELAALEKELVTEELLKQKECLNLKVGGEGAVLCGSNNGMFGKKRSAEHKAKVSQKLKGRAPTNARPIVVEGVEYPDQYTASRITGIKVTTIGKRILSKSDRFKDTYYVDSPKAASLQK